MLGACFDCDGIIGTNGSNQFKLNTLTLLIEKV